MFLFERKVCLSRRLAEILIATKQLSTIKDTTDHPMKVYGLPFGNAEGQSDNATHSDVREGICCRVHFVVRKLVIFYQLRKNFSALEVRLVVVATCTASH